jgi:hypothetical protein
MVEKEFCMFYDEEEIRGIREIREDSGDSEDSGRFGKIREDLIISNILSKKTNQI